MELLEKELTEKIIGVCLEISNEVGAGFLESVYQKATLLALQQDGLDARAQVPLEVCFRGSVVGEFFADILVEGRVILELKASRSLLPEHEAQLMNYLRATGIRVGLLINFGKPRMEWRRIVF